MSVSAPDSADSADSASKLRDNYAAALSSPQTQSVFQKWRTRLADARQRETNLMSVLNDQRATAHQRAAAQKDLEENAVQVMFCAEQVQWYALHMSKVAAGDADPDLDNRQW